MNENNWYDNYETEKSSTYCDWYAPHAEPQHQVTYTPELPKKKKKKVWMPICATLLVLALMIGTALIFRQPGDTAATAIIPRSEGNEARPERPKNPEMPKESEKPDNPDSSDEMPDDWMEFFDNYYEKADTSEAEVNIEKADLPTDFSLTLIEAKGRELTLQKLYEKCSVSIVAISGYSDGQVGYNWGTGVILSEDGLILTNTHVIDDCDRATVTLFDDREFEATLIGADTISDIALLRIEATGLVPAEFGESNSLKVGDRVCAIGNPLGETFRSTLTDGIISAISRGISYKGRSMTLLQTNTALNEGNSGGALFNMHGQVIGITNMKMMSAYSSIEGIGFAIPSSTVQEVVNSLVRYGEVRGRPSIGITVGGIPDEAKTQYALPSGLYISEVIENSDAYAKGIRPGDVLMEVNHVPVTTTAEVSEMKKGLEVGDTMLFKIWHNGEIFEVEVELMETNDLNR